MDEGEEDGYGDGREVEIGSPSFGLPWQYQIPDEVIQKTVHQKKVHIKTE